MIGYDVANRSLMHRNLASRYRVGIELLMVAIDEVQMIKKDEAIRNTCIKCDPKPCNNEN